MKKYFLKTKNGFALLYAIVIISVISVIAFGLASVTLKQKILSSLAVDSQTAFYTADAGMECALFFNQKIFNPLTPGNNMIPCYDIDPNNFGQIVQVSTLFNPPQSPYVWYIASRKEPCFYIELIPPGIPPASPKPSISVKGYNTCIPNQNRYVERNLRAYF